MNKRFDRKKQAGLGLIELMISLVLGLLIIGAVASVMLSNMQGFRTTQGLSQVQESTRFGFELLARDIRQAASVPCGTDIQIVNILNEAQGNNVPWQFNVANAVRGLSGTEALAGVTNRIDGTEALVLISGDAGGAYVENYDTGNNSANFTVGSAGPSHNLANGDILLVCNEKQGTVFQMTQGQGNNAGKIIVNTGNSASPGNCTKGLGPIVPGNNVNQPCNTNGVAGPYGRNTVISKLVSRAWYIGNNGRPNEGGRSLYLAELGANASGDSVINTFEIAAGINNLSMRYRLKDTADFVAATAVGTQWERVNAIEIQLDVVSQDQNVSTATASQGRLSRSLTSVVAIRNRSL